MARNYKKEYKHFHSKPDQKKRRAGRNAARRKLLKSGAVKKGDGKDVHHPNGYSKGSKTVVEPAEKNRGRKEKSRKKGYNKK